MEKTIGVRCDGKLSIIQRNLNRFNLTFDHGTNEVLHIARISRSDVLDFTHRRNIGLEGIHLSDDGALGCRKSNIANIIDLSDHVVANELSLRRQSLEAALNLVGKRPGDFLGLIRHIANHVH